MGEKLQLNVKQIIGLLLLIIITTSISACTSKASQAVKLKEKSLVSESKDDKNVTNSYKELDKLPQKYTSELAKKNGDIVNVHGINSNTDKLDTFIKNFENKKLRVNDMVRITTYTDEGYAIIRDLIVDNKGVKLIEDNTRDFYSTAGDRIRAEYRIVDILKTNETAGTTYTVKTDKGEEKYLFYINK